jgi:hypothetical protein
VTTILSAKELQAKIELAEGEKASAAAKAHAAADAEKHAFIERISKPSGLTDDQIIEKASHIVNRAVENGLTSVHRERPLDHHGREKELINWPHSASPWRFPVVVRARKRPVFGAFPILV